MRRSSLERRILPPPIFLVAGILVFLSFSAAGIVAETAILRALAVSLAEREAGFIGHHLEQLYFRPGVFLDSSGKISIPEPMPREVREELEALGIVMLKVYNIAGRVVASTDPRHVGQVRKESSRFREALEGKVVGNLATKEYYRDFYGEEASEDLLEIYVPVWSAAVDAPAGVMEIYRPWSFYSPIIERSLQLTVAVSGGLALIFGIALLVIHFWVTGRARKAGEEIAGLEDCLARARSEGRPGTED